MDLEEIRNIVELMKENDLSLFNMERDGFKLKLRRGPDQEPVAYYQPAPQQAAPPPSAGNTAPPAGNPPPVETTGGNLVRSIMVGTFYRSPGPGEKSFVNVGDTVEPNTTICIIEAMKVMNEIKAETSGVITRVLVQDGTAVQYDTPLFEVTPA